MCHLGPYVFPFPILFYSIKDGVPHGPFRYYHFPIFDVSIRSLSLVIGIGTSDVGGGFSQRDSLSKTESRLRPFCAEHILLWHAQYKKSASFISNIFLESIFTHPEYLDFGF